MSILVGLALARVFVQNLGAEIYGLYLMLSLFSSYGILSMLDFGMGGAVTTFTARYQFAQPEKVKELWTFSILYFSLIAVIAGMTGLIILQYFDHGITTRLLSLGISRSVMVPTLILVVLTFLSYLVDSFLRGFSDFGYMQRTTVAIHILRLLGLCVIITQRIIFDAIMWWLIVCTSVRFIILLMYLRRIYPDFICLGRFRQVDASTWGRYSITLFISSITGFVFNVADKLLISMFLPVVAMANYDIAAKPERMMRGGLSVLLSTIMPISARYHALDQIKQLQEMFFRGSSWLSMILIPPLVFITVMMPDFISIWVGQQHVWLAPLGQAMLLYLYFSLSASLANTIMVGMGMAKNMITGQIASTVVNFAISAGCVHRFGLYGVVAGAFAGYLIAALFYYRLIWQALAMNIELFKTKLLLPNVLMFVIPLAISCIRYLVPTTLNLPIFFGFGGLVIVISYVLYYFSIMSDVDRQFVLDSYQSALTRFSRK